MATSKTTTRANEPAAHAPIAATPAPIDFDAERKRAESYKAQQNASAFPVELLVGQWGVPHIDFVQRKVSQAMATLTVAISDFNEPDEAARRDFESTCLVIEQARRLIDDVGALTDRVKGGGDVPYYQEIHRAKSLLCVIDSQLFGNTWAPLHNDATMSSYFDSVQDLLQAVLIGNGTPSASAAVSDRPAPPSVVVDDSTDADSAVMDDRRRVALEATWEIAAFTEMLQREREQEGDSQFSILVRSSVNRIATLNSMLMSFLGTKDECTLTEMCLVLEDGATAEVLASS